MFAVAIPFILITTIVVVLRIFVRLRLLSVKLMMDDCKLRLHQTIRLWEELTGHNRLDDYWYNFHYRSFGSKHDL